MKGIIIEMHLVIKEEYIKKILLTDTPSILSKGK